MTASASLKNVARRSFGLLISLALVLTCFVSLAVVFVLDRAVTRYARARLVDEGVTCDARFSLSVTLVARSVTVHPTRCTTNDAGVASVELLDPAVVTFDGTTLASIRGGSVVVALRDAPSPVRPEGFGAALEALAVPERLFALTVAGVELTRAGLPRTEVARIDVRRGTDPWAVLAGLVWDPASTEPLHVTSIDLPTPRLARGATVRWMDVVGRTGPSFVLEGDLFVDASLPRLGTVRRNSRLAITVSGLSGGSPSFDVHLEGTDSRGTRRSR